MPLYDLNLFLRLSADLNYLLVVKPTNWRSVLEIILHDQHLPKSTEAILIETMAYLDQVYGRRRRRLGAQAIIHPLRAASLLARCMPVPSHLDLMATLLHDRFEDFPPASKPSDFGELVDETLGRIMHKLPADERWFLTERLYWLTKRPGENYYNYIGRMLGEASRTPEAVRVKLADRLDNTLDMRMDLQDTFDHVDFFEQLFQMMFLPDYTPNKAELQHPVRSSMDGSERLYQLYKNIVLISLVRQRGAAESDPISHTLFELLIRASIKEAQRIALHIFSYHQTDISRMRDLVIDTMIYVQSGGIDAVTAPALGKRLDGLFMLRFNEPDKRVRKKKLQELYKDKDLMVEASIAFIVIYYRFLNDPDYFVHGISEDGIRPE
jgi:hypothetical protein